MHNAAPESPYHSASCAGVMCAGPKTTRSLSARPCRSEIPHSGPSTGGSLVGSLVRKGRIRPGERAEAHLFAVDFREHFFCPMCGRRALDEGRMVDRFPRSTTPISRPSQSPASEGSSQGSAEGGGAESISDAQFKIALLYGFASWPSLKAHVDSLEEIGELTPAIDTNDVARVKALMTRDPTLHRAPLAHASNRPLTRVAECRVPWAPPSPERLATAGPLGSVEPLNDCHPGEFIEEGDHRDGLPILRGRQPYARRCGRGAVPADSLACRDH
jgi:hypothetical protein